MNDFNRSYKSRVLGESVDVVVGSRISVAPMIDWTTPTFRTFVRLFSPHATLYTEMVSTSALLKSNAATAARHLFYYPNEAPVVLQLGGNHPTELAECAKLGEQAGFSAINFNVGCPSDKVQQGQIGACLMKTPTRVAECVAAMAAAVNIPITIKHRIGVDEFDSYDFMHDFVSINAAAGIRHFIVHARAAWLNGLSPKENRTIPPLRYDEVYRLKREFTNLTIEINGGINEIIGAKTHLQHTDGVMIGRAAYHNPYFLNELNALFGTSVRSYAEIFADFLAQISSYDEKTLTHAARHYLGFFHGLKGGKIWRQTLSGKKVITFDAIQAAGKQVLAQNY